MKRLMTPERLAFVVPVLSMIAIVLLTVFASSLLGSEQTELSNLEPYMHTTIFSF